MKRKLQSIIIASLCFMAFTPKGFSQTTVNVDANANWVGYANVFDLSNVYQFGQSWGVSDIKTDVNTTLNTLTLYPNYNTYNATDPYWSNGAIGNKIFEGNTYVENAALAGQTLTFTGLVVSKTISSNYQNFAFIKGLDPNNGYSATVNVTVPLVAGQNFSVVATNIPPGLIVQYGFTVKGINANPVDMATLGNIVVGPRILSVASFENSNVSLYPNPATNTFTIQAKTIIDSITVYNVLGQEVKSSNPNAMTSTLDISDLQSGVYIVKTSINGLISSTRLIKK